MRAEKVCMHNRNGKERLFGLGKRLYRRRLKGLLKNLRDMERLMVIYETFNNQQLRFKQKYITYFLTLYTNNVNKASAFVIIY